MISLKYFKILLFFYFYFFYFILKLQFCSKSHHYLLYNAMIGKHVGMDKRLPGHAFDLSGERERERER